MQGARIHLRRTQRIRKRFENDQFTSLEPLKEEDSKESKANLFKDTESPFLSSSDRARIVAKKLFHFLCPPNKNCIDLENLLPYFKQYDDAKEAFEIFDKDGNGTITRKELKSTVMDIYRERKRLSTSMVDVENALGKLHHIMFSFVIFLSIFIWLALFNVNITVSLFSSSFFFSDFQLLITSLASILVAITFIVGNSAKSALYDPSYLHLPRLMLPANPSFSYSLCILSMLVTGFSSTSREILRTCWFTRSISSRPSSDVGMVPRFTFQIVFSRLNASKTFVDLEISGIRSTSTWTLIRPARTLKLLEAGSSNG